MSTSPTIRALFAAATSPSASPPHDTLHLKVHHPAAPTGSDTERLTGVIPADDTLAPFPVAVILNGINVGPEAYGWLAQHLAGLGIVTVTYSWVGELFPGQHGLTPGLDLSAVRPETYGTRPSATAVEPVLAALADLAAEGPLAGHLDLDRVALVGHSAGGTVVLQNATRDHFPGVRCGVSFAAHAGVATVLGWPEGTVLPCPGDVPLLLLGGTNDGVIARSADRYGDGGHARDPLERTFDESVADDRTAHLAVLAGANHFALGHPEDPTVARGFLDGPQELDGGEARGYLGDLIGTFLRLHLRGEATAESRLEELLADPRLATSRSK